MRDHLPTGIGTGAMTLFLMFRDSTTRVVRMKFVPPTIYVDQVQMVRIERVLEDAPDDLRLWFYEERG